jgi:hypothetical protein
MVLLAWAKAKGAITLIMTSEDAALGGLVLDAVDITVIEEATLIVPPMPLASVALGEDVDTNVISSTEDYDPSTYSEIDSATPEPGHFDRPRPGQPARTATLASAPGPGPASIFVDFDERIPLLGDPDVESGTALSSEEWRRMDRRRFRIYRIVTRSILFLTWAFLMKPMVRTPQFSQTRCAHGRLRWLVVQALDVEPLGRPVCSATVALVAYIRRGTSYRACAYDQVVHRPLLVFSFGQFFAVEKGCRPWSVSIGFL